MPGAADEHDRLGYRTWRSPNDRIAISPADRGGIPQVTDTRINATASYHAEIPGGAVDRIFRPGDDFLDL